MWRTGRPIGLQNDASWASFSPIPPYSLKLNYRVVVGKHNLAEAEPSAQAYFPAKKGIIVHKHYNPVLLSVG